MLAEDFDIPDGFFLAHAPGSTEIYLVPDIWSKDFKQWCECKLFDTRWKQWQEFFKPYEICPPVANKL